MSESKIGIKRESLWSWDSLGLQNSGNSNYQVHFEEQQTSLESVGLPCWIKIDDCYAVGQTDP